MTMETTTISGRENATVPLTGAERVPMDQGTQTVDASTQQIADLANPAIQAALAAHLSATDPHPSYTTAAEAAAAAPVQSVQWGALPAGWTGGYGTGTGTGNVELTLSLPAGSSLVSTGDRTNWNTAFSERNRWDGLALGLDPVAGRASLLLGSAALAATTDFATPAALSAGLAAKADLVGGVVPTSQIPAIAISEYLGAVASQAAMLTLVGQRGDWCIRTESGAGAGAWILAGEPSSLLASWVQIPMPAVPVQSVQGQVGAVVLGPGDVGAATAAQGALAATAIQPGNPALSDSREWSAETVSQAEAEAGTATTRRAFTAQRVRQAITAWWSGYASAVGQAVATAANAAAALAAIGGMPRTIETVDVAYPTATATINIDFAADNGKTLIVATLTGPLTFTFSNIAQGRSVSVDMLCGGTQQALTFPAATPFVGTKPSNIAANKAASLTFECRRSGTTDASVRAAYGVQA